MVTRGVYYDHEEQLSRRYSSRGHGYPLSQDRELPPALHGPYSRQHMTSQNRQSPEQDNNAQPRRRIPVACGRCRKRKIRCSGDPGNGEPCSNCKSAGNDTCQFLRVSSTEAQMKNDAAADYGYDSAAPRGHCRMSPYGPQHQPYTPHVTSLGIDGYPSSRQNSLSAYQKPIMFYPTPSSYGEFADENVDYGMHASSYSILNQEPINISYPSAGSIRGWSQGPQVQKSTSLFVEQEPSYSHDQLWTGLKSFPMRPQISPESKNLSLNGMSTALPAPMNGTDRVLPFPASSRTAQIGPSSLRSTESFLPMSQSSIQYGNNGLMSSSMMNAVKALNASATSENASLSGTYLSSSPDSVPSSHIGSFGAHSVSLGSHNHDSYASSHDSHHSQSLFQQGNDSSNDLSSCSYAPSGSGSQRQSVGSLAAGENSQSGTSDNEGGPLANGQYYQPAPSAQISYATPPIVDPRDMQPAVPILVRHPVSAS